MDSYKQSARQHYFALIKPLLTLDSSEHMICLVCFNTEYCQITKIILLSTIENPEVPSKPRPAGSVTIHPVAL